LHPIPGQPLDPLRIAFGQPGSTATSIGIGTLISNSTTVDTHLLSPQHLREQLLGLEPYVDQGCRAEFTAPTPTTT
jgi:hypothetical protein